MNSRTAAAVVGVCLMAMPAAALMSVAGAADTNSPPAGCNVVSTITNTVDAAATPTVITGVTTVTTPLETTPTTATTTTTPTTTTPTTTTSTTPTFNNQGDVDVDCVTLTFTKLPDDETTSTSAELNWKASVYGVPFLDTWTNWDQIECRLDGVVVACPTSPTFSTTGLSVGQHTFTVSARTPRPRFACEIEGPIDPADFVVPCTDRSAAKTTSSVTEACENPEPFPGYLACAKVIASATWRVVAPPATTVAAPPVTAAAPVTVARTCISRRGILKVRLREHRGKRIRSAKVFFNGQQVAVATRDRADRLTASVNFNGLPSGRFALQIKATLTNGRKVSFTRRYFTCKPKLAPSNNLGSPNAL